MTATMTKAERDLMFRELTERADAAGRKAVEALTVVPMVVTERVNPFDDSSAVRKAWYVADGACGFAWITIRPGNSPLANYLKKTGLAKPAYGGGVSIWVSAYNQSIQKKEAYAAAYAEVLRAAGFTAYAGSRMD